MTQTEQKVFEIISERKKIRISEIAKETRLSTDYIRLICLGLQRNGFINFSKGLCSIREEETFEKKTVQKTSKTAKKKEVVQKKKEARGEKKKIEKTSLFNLENVNEKLAKKLIGAGFKNIESLSEAPISRLMEISGIELKQAADIINEARKKLGKLGGSNSLF